MEVKAVFFDIDGTLVNDSRTVLKSTEKAIQSLKEQGILVGLATGRGPFFVKPFMEQLDLDFAVTYNGQYIFSRDRVISASPIDKQSLRDLIAYAKKHRKEISLGTAEAMLGSKIMSFGMSPFSQWTSRFIPKRMARTVSHGFNKVISKALPQHEKDLLQLIQEPIYQALISGTDEETEITEETLVGSEAVESGYYHQYDPDFFDLIIIDECHRGGAKDDGNWAEILKYFSSAVHLGMTATPKNQDNINTYAYFGEPVYQYSLKEGIEDGFLTPYKVKRIRTNLDELVIDDKVEILGGDKEKDLYELKDFDRKIIVPERIDLIAKTILEHIKPHEKTIIFCVDQEHAALMRDAINKHKTVRDGDYCVRVTSNEGEI